MMTTIILIILIIIAAIIGLAIIGPIKIEFIYDNSDEESKEIKESEELEQKN